MSIKILLKDDEFVRAVRGWVFFVVVFLNPCQPTNTFLFDSL